MKIVIVTGSYLPYVGGVSSSTHNIARAMADLGHTVTVIAPTPLKADPTVDHEKNIRVVRTWAWPDPWYRGRTMTPIPFLIPSVWRTITKDTDIVHIQEPLAVGITALVAARWAGVPVVGALHFTPEQNARMLPLIPRAWVISFAKAFIRWVYNRYDAIMVPTQTFVDFLKAVGVVRPTMVVSNGVDTNEYVPVKKPASKTVTFLIVGRLDRDKYVDDSVMALPHADKRIHLIIAGEGGDKERLHALAKSLGVYERIEWIGLVDNKEMLDLYRKADGFIMMGVHEVQSIVTLQAIASGLPVVAARAGALPELVHDGVNGFLVPPHDSKTLAEKLNLLVEAKLRASMGAQGRAISMHHDRPKAMKKLSDWYGTIRKR